MVKHLTFLTFLLLLRIVVPGMGFYSWRSPSRKLPRRPKRFADLRCEAVEDSDAPHPRKVTLDGEKRREEARKQDEEARKKRTKRSKNQEGEEEEEAKASSRRSR